MGIIFTKLHSLFRLCKIQCGAQCVLDEHGSLKGCLAIASAVKGSCARLLGLALPNGYAILMSTNKDETAAHGCHYLGDMAVHVCKLLARSWVDACVTLFSLIL